MNIIDKLTLCLEEERILPASEETGNALILNHSCPETKQKTKRTV